MTLRTSTLTRHVGQRAHAALGRVTTAPTWRRRLAASGPSDRGDVPGWVLVTLMTAGLVVAIWAVAGPALTTMFTNSLNSVTGP
ncbi:hypothetical protein [Sanguibacter antarcticus]|uniref:Uncharacterized protein n=1 Tax=Sanguibacter antarcticus TaxID=372484 RepID=A0A2A9E669_9MICO|nr:hypothetical protein [Sanguibacter antarcticus]PFG33689.1 hypothetical protein ATL42_1576 [Sanguibacter antarcticus]